MYYYEVAPTTIVRSDSPSLTYTSKEPLSIGSIATIPVGKRELIGVVIKSSPKPDYEVREINGLLDIPPLPKELIATALWMSEYYLTHLSTVLQTILPRGVNKKRRITPHLKPAHKRDRTKNVFTESQQRAIDQISALDSGTALLHGVTGSGKTLVYIESAKATVADNQSAIILVPEIALTSQLVAEFSKHFESIKLTHSRQTEAERHIVWEDILRSSEPQVVIGPRSALFMPVRNLGLIVIDEFHEPSFKQEQAPKYSALRTASILAKQHSAKVILGSATPNISDYYLAEKSDSPIISMATPARSDTIPPQIQLIDMTKRNNFTSHPFISNLLIEELEKTFAAGSQALIFHNRRGSASTTLCENCGWQAGCPRCFVPLTLHSDSHHLRCHICNLTSDVPTSCPSCHHADIIHKGVGTKRIEAELRKLFPKQTLARFDGDTESNASLDQRYTELYDGSIDLIIGTQVIAKGLDLPHLRTVGVIQADAGLSLPDFTAPERTFQLLAQVIGRVGRSNHQTQVVVQSFQPDHPAIKDGLSRDYRAFYDRTIALRKHTNFPPFCHLLKLTCAYKTEAAAIKNARELTDILKNSAPDQVQVLGPTPAFYERVRDTYRWQIVVKSPRRQDLVDLLSYLPKKYWQFELDPMSLL